MPAAHPPEFRRRALDLVAQGNPVGQTARDLGISEPCLWNWMNRDAIDGDHKSGVTSSCAAGCGCWGWRTRLSSAPAPTSPGRTCCQIGFRLVQELAADGVPVAMACWFLKVSTSGYYDWRNRSPSLRDIADVELTRTIRRIHAGSRATYGAPRVLAELRLGLGVHVARKHIARLTRLDGVFGIYHRRKRRGWKLDTATHADLVKRQLRADAPNRLWFCDITQNRARHG